MRVVRLALAVLLVAFVAPSSAVSRELVLVANGPAHATVTLPAGTELRLWEARFQTEAQYAALTVSTAREVIGVAAKLPGPYSRFPYVPLAPKHVGGRLTLRLVTSGPTKVRIPTDGLTRVVWLTKRLQGAAVFSKDAVASPPSVVRDDLPVSVLAGSVVIHGIDMSKVVTQQEASAMCVEPGADPCRGLSVLDTRWRYVQIYYPDDGLTGALHAKVLVAMTGAALTPLPHFVIAVPG